MAPRSFVNLAIVCRERSMASLARWISSAELLSSLSVSVTSFGAVFEAPVGLPPC